MKFLNIYKYYIILKITFLCYKKTIQKNAYKKYMIKKKDIFYKINLIC